MKKKLFYGWIVVLATLLLSLMGGGMVSALSVFVLPLMKAFKYTQAQVSGIFSMITFGTLIGSLTLGKLIGKSDIRKLVLIFGVLQGAAIITFAFANQRIIFYAIALFIGFLVVVVNIISIPILITNWFKAKKGTALGIAAAGIGMGSVVFAPVLTMVIDKSGYKTAFMVYGGTVIVLAIICWIIVRTRPEEMGLKAYGLNEGDPQDTHAGGNNTQDISTGLTLKEALKTPAYWLIAVFAIGSTLAQLSVFVQTNAYIRTIGYTGAKYSMIILAFGLCSMAGKIFVGTFLDKLGLTKGGLIASVMGILAICGLIVVKNNPSALYLYIIFAGGGVMLSAIALPMLVSKSFGVKHYSSIFTSVAVITTVSAIIGSYASGAIVDHMGYVSMYVYALTCFIVAIVAYVIVNKTSASKKTVTVSEKVTV